MTDLWSHGVAADLVYENQELDSLEDIQVYIHVIAVCSGAPSNVDTNGAEWRVCVCVCMSEIFALCSLYRYMYIAPDLCVCVCVCVCARACIMVCGTSGDLMRTDSYAHATVLHM